MEHDLAALYSGIGHPSIPQMLLRAMLLQAFYSVRSERQLMERMEFDLLFRFVGLGGRAGLGRLELHEESRPAAGRRRGHVLPGDAACAPAREATVDVFSRRKPARRPSPDYLPRVRQVYPSPSACPWCPPDHPDAVPLEGAFDDRDQQVELLIALTRQGLPISRGEEGAAQCT